MFCKKKLISGKRKGEECGKKCKEDSAFCGIHKNIVPVGETLPGVPIIMADWSNSKILKEIRSIFKTIHPDSLLSADAKEYLIDLAKQRYSDIQLENIMHNAWQNARKSKRWTVRKVDF